MIIIIHFYKQTDKLLILNLITIATNKTKKRESPNLPITDSEKLTNGK